MKDIKGFEGLYAITEDGEVYSYRSKKFLSKKLTAKGYYEVLFSVDGKRTYKRVHKLVAETFLPNPKPNELTQVNHKNEIKTDNRVENLEWISPIDNCNYGTRNDRISSKLKVKVQCVETGKVYDSVAAAAFAINRTERALLYCLSGKYQTCAKLHWKYYNEVILNESNTAYGST